MPNVLESKSYKWVSWEKFTGRGKKRVVTCAKNEKWTCVPKLQNSHFNFYNGAQPLQLQQPVHSRETLGSPTIFCFNDGEEVRGSGGLGWGAGAGRVRNLKVEKESERRKRRNNPKTETQRWQGQKAALGLWSLAQWTEEWERGDGERSVHLADKLTVVTGVLFAELML